ncbi:hypothetical protein [Paracoccus sp. ME4]|uniref:hypothetical protein n=1 Tax=Paracoccus sp. ME4 TaxID=3138066 RepID=UPI00398A5E8C
MMVQTFVDLYQAYPDAMIRHMGRDPAGIDPALLGRLRDHRREQLALLAAAHHFRIEQDAEDMLFRLIHELGEAAAEDAFHRVRMPFPVVFLERGASTDDGSVRAALITQAEGRLQVQSFATLPGAALPSLLVSEVTEMQMEQLATPTLELIEEIAGASGAQEPLRNEEQINSFFVKLAVSLATLLAHTGMLEVQDMPAVPRAERRRAEREGRPAPTARISMIRLGEAGRGQLQAMRAGPAGETGDAMARRAHWVRGHFMRTKTGDLTWRMPHIRGAGPVIKGMRRIGL